MRPLRQSTASQEILLGPFVDSAGAPLTSLTIANTDIKLCKGGATSEVNKNSGGATHIAGGRYSAVIDATDSDTTGILEVSVNATGALPFTKSYVVFQTNVFDALYAGTDFLETTPLAQDFTISGATLTHRKRDGSTTQGTKTISTTAGADPITGLD